jgi:hypothetical protein
MDAGAGPLCVVQLGIRIPTGLGFEPIQSPQARIVETEVHWSTDLKLK